MNRKGLVMRKVLCIGYSWLFIDYIDVYLNFKYCWYNYKINLVKVIGA